MCVYVRVCMCAGVYVCMCACMIVCMCDCVHACMCACVHVRMCACLLVCLCGVSRCACRCMQVERVPCACHPPYSQPPWRSRPLGSSIAPRHTLTQSTQNPHLHGRPMEADLSSQNADFQPMFPQASPHHLAGSGRGGGWLVSQSSAVPSPGSATDHLQQTAAEQVKN
jgi:hypothetical protein